jgi:hypothetical protein
MRQLLRHFSYACCLRRSCRRTTLNVRLMSAQVRKL